jgi:hypothetical protein
MTQHELSKQLRGRNLLGQFPPEDQDTLFCMFDHETHARTQNTSLRESVTSPPIQDSRMEGSGSPALGTSAHTGERRLLVGDLWKKLDQFVHETHEANDHSRRKMVRGFLATKHEEVGFYYDTLTL